MFGTSRTLLLAGLAVTAVTLGLTAGLTLLMPPDVLAQEGDGFLFRRRIARNFCQPVHHYAHQQHHAHYVEPAIALLTPVQDYPYNHGHAYNQQVAAVLAPPYYWSVTEAYQQKAMLREVVREEMQSFFSKPVSTQQVVPQQPVQPPSKKIDALPPQKQTINWEPDTLTPPDIQATVLEAFNSACISCHGGGGKDSKGLKLVLPKPDGGYALTALPPDKHWTVYGMVSVGAMPPGARNDPQKRLPSKYMQALLDRAVLAGKQ